MHEERPYDYAVAESDGGRQPFQPFGNCVVVVAVVVAA